MTKLRITMLAVTAGLAGLSLLAGCSAGQTKTAVAEQSPQAFNDADVAFTQQMIVHHRQSIAMAQAAQVRAADARVRNFATKIAAEEGPQIATMTTWLHTWQQPVPGASATPGARTPTPAGTP